MTFDKIEALVYHMPGIHLCVPVFVPYLTVKYVLLEAEWEKQ